MRGRLAFPPRTARPCRVAGLRRLAVQSPPWRPLMLRVSSRVGGRLVCPCGQIGWGARVFHPVMRRTVHRAHAEAEHGHKRPIEPLRAKLGPARPIRAHRALAVFDGSLASRATLPRSAPRGRPTIVCPCGRIGAGSPGRLRGLFCQVTRPLHASGDDPPNTCAAHRPCGRNLHRAWFYPERRSPEASPLASRLVACGPICATTGEPTTGSPDALAGELVAGAGFEPATFEL